MIYNSYYYGANYYASQYYGGRPDTGDGADHEYQDAWEAEEEIVMATVSLFMELIA